MPASSITSSMSSTANMPMIGGVPLRNRRTPAVGV